jgi:hypothetical protein
MERYHESTNKLNNLCILLRTNYKFIILQNIIYNETYSDTKLEDINFCSTIFSNIPTPFKLKNNFETPYIIELYESQMPDSETFKIYKAIENYILNTDSYSSRYIKYYAKKMNSIGMFKEAQALYQESDVEFDNEMKKDYLKNLVNCDQTLNATDFFYRLSIEMPDAIKYFAISELHSKILKNINTIKSINISLCLYLYKDIQDTSLNKTAISISLNKYTQYIGVSRPSELKFSDEDHKTIMFLEHICNRDMLCKSMLFRFQKDAYDERIKICNLLTTRKLSNVDKLVFETKELSKRKVLEDATQHVSSSKVYADKDFVRTNTWNDYINYFNEYININIESIDVQAQLKETGKLLSERPTITDPFLEFMSNQLRTYLDIGDDLKSKHIFSMLKCVIEEYCFGIKGLNGYLSTRIRHQTFFSTLLGPLINEGIVSDDKITKSNSFLSSMEEVETSTLNNVLSEQLKFNEKITKAVNNLLYKNVQICANNKGNDDCAFNYKIEIDTILSFKKQLGGTPSINESWQIIESWLVEQTNNGCSIIQKLINNELRCELEKCLNDFELKIEKLLGESKTHNKNLTLNKIRKSRPLLFNQLNVVSSWFDIDQSYVEQEYSFDIVTDIAMTMLNTESIISKNLPDIILPHKLLSPLVDLFHNIFSNAIKYSNLESNNLDIKISATQDDSFIYITIKNNSSFKDDINNENIRLEKYKAKLSITELKTLLQKEGGSGIAKIKCILRNDLFSDDTVDLRYYTNDEFIISFSINKASGIILNENTYS